LDGYMSLGRGSALRGQFETEIILRERAANIDVESECLENDVFAHLLEN
jgi:hypothetical protein